MPPSTLVELGGDRRSSCALNNFNSFSASIYVITQDNHSKRSCIFFLLSIKTDMWPSHTLTILPHSSLLAYLRVFFHFLQIKKEGKRLCRFHRLYSTRRIEGTGQNGIREDRLEVQSFTLVYTILTANVT